MRVIKISLALLSAAAILSLAACNQKPGSRVLAKVNGVVLTEEDLRFQPKDGHGKPPEYGSKSINDIINQELLSQQGLRLGLDQDVTFQRKLAAFSGQPAGAKRLELARRVFNTEIAARIDVRPQEAKDYYEKNAEQIATELHLMLAKFGTKAEAEQAMKKLKAGADFVSIARPVMKGSAREGNPPWDLGFLKWQQIPVDFVDQIYSLKPGEVSEPLGSHRTGFQIVKLIEKRKIPGLQYEAVATVIMSQLRDLRLLNAYNEYMETLRKGANIVTF